MTNYLEKLQNIKEGEFVFIKGKYDEAEKTKVISINGDEVTTDRYGNSKTELWKFSLKTSNAINPPFAYWISTES